MLPNIAKYVPVLHRQRKKASRTREKLDINSLSELSVGLGKKKSIHHVKKTGNLPNKGWMGRAPPVGSATAAAGRREVSAKLALIETWEIWNGI